MRNTPKELKHLFHEIQEWIHLQRSLGKNRVFFPSSSQRRSQKMTSKSRASFSDLSFSEVREVALKCVKCPLSQGRTQVVFGSGNEKAQLVFVGEAPGFEEDRQGQPFVGKAGQLLTKMIEAMGLKREDVYISNIVKCRPPNNRTPKLEEIETCLPYLIAQLEEIKPKIICALGNVAAQTLLKSDKTISRLRGMFHEVGGIKLMPTFHPAFLLRNPEYKREVWHDLKLIMDALGLKKNKE
jgi:DNA polymerase